MTVWGLVMTWLLISMIASVANAIFYGDGPLNPDPPPPAGIEAPPTPTPPTP